MTRPCETCTSPFTPKKEYKGHIRRYCSKSCAVKAQHVRGEIGFEKFNPQWNGGVHWDRGYKMLWMPGHPLAHKDGYVYEHRLNAEERLFPGCIVHHKNHIRDDNRPENLEVITRAQHNRGHIREVKV